ARVLPRVHRPVLAVRGARVPVTADDPDRILRAPVWAAALLAIGYAGGLVAAIRQVRDRPEARLLLAAAALPLIVFPLSNRAGPEAVRFLTPAYLPLAALSVASMISAVGARRAWIVVLGLSALHL